MITLGVKVTDKITGFTGIVTGKVEYISGCNQVLVAPKVDKDGKIPDSHWFDVQRVQIDLAEPVLYLDNAETPGFDSAPPKR